jgi:hypothetical protein
VTPELTQWLQLLLVPVTGLLWNISHKLGTLTAVQAAHAAQLATHETRITRLEQA